MNFAGAALATAPSDQVFELFLDGAPYRSAADIARTHGYVRDYVARLCREGKVRGRRLGRLWYVDAESFAAFLRHHDKRSTAVAPHPML